MAGSPRMLGASALCGLAAMRSGAGLTTLAVPKSLNTALQKKISPVLMTLPLTETSQKTFSSRAWHQLKDHIGTYQAAAIGPGLTRNDSTQKFIHSVCSQAGIPLVIDADGLNALPGQLDLLNDAPGPRILTPHVGEMARLCGGGTGIKEELSRLAGRLTLAKALARAHNCIIVLKSHRTIVASPTGKTFTNKTGNAGMATAGSGDVLTGMVTAFLAQGLKPFEAARWAVELHGRAGDQAARKQGKTGMVATDIIKEIPNIIKHCQATRSQGSKKKRETD